MSQKMTDEEATAADKAITAAGWVAPRGDSVGAKVRADWLRARSEEARLLEENKRQANDLAVVRRQVELISHILGVQRWGDVLNQLPPEFRSTHLMRTPGAAVLATKDDQIQALADALEAHGFRDLDGVWHAAQCRQSDDCGPECTRSSAALRLCGRIP